MNIILGSGVIALIARHILGSNYKIFNYGRSRFYQYNPALADNFIRFTSELSEFSSITESLGIKGEKHEYKCCWSISGDIIKEYDSILCSKWINKIHHNMSDHISILMKNRMEFEVYSTRITDLYTSLNSKYADNLNDYNINNISSIGKNVIHMKNGNHIEFDRCISTIPLNKLYQLMNNPTTLESADITAVLLESNDINMEGFNQMYVADDSIPFFKVIQVKPKHYVFYFTGKVEHPALTIGLCVDSFDLISGMFIKDCIPSGQLIKHGNLADNGIIPLGMSSQWDYGMDISSCIFRLLKISTNHSVF